MEEKNIFLVESLYVVVRSGAVAVMMRDTKYAEKSKEKDKALVLNEVINWLG